MQGSVLFNVTFCALKYIIKLKSYLTTRVQLSYIECILKTRYQAIGTYPKTNILATMVLFLKLHNIVRYNTPAVYQARYPQKTS